MSSEESGLFWWPVIWTKYIAIVLLFIATGYALWYIFFRKKAVKYARFSGEWRGVLRKRVGFYARLSTDEKRRFESDVLAFLNTVEITGVGVSVEDADRLLVASSAVIPLFGFPGWRYKNLNEVLLYEDSFDENYRTSGSDRNILGQVGTGAMQRMMLLSKPALHKGFAQAGTTSNVGIHEFVHLLDKADGTIDGIPELIVDQQFVIPWFKLMHEEIRKVKLDRSDINPYGITNEAEFLSVVSEYFFNQSERFAERHPELFQIMEGLYRQDLDGDGSYLR